MPCITRPRCSGSGLLLGLDTLVSQAYGRKDHDECHHWLAQGVYLACIVTPPMMVLTVAASYGFARFGITPEVAGLAGGYLRILNWGTLPLLLYGAARRYLQGVGQVRVITLTYYRQPAQLVRQLGPDLRQARIAGAGREWLGDFDVHRACRHGGGVDRLCLALRAQPRPSAVSPLGRPQLDQIRQLVRLGAPAAGQILLEVGAWNLATLSAGYLTPVALATHPIALNYASVTYMVPLGMSAAAAVSVGHARGRRRSRRARRAGWLAIALGTGFMVLAAIVFLVAPRPLITLYTRDPRVMAVGPSLSVVAAAFQIFDGIQTVCTGALRGLGETRVPMIANFVGYWILGLPLGCHFASCSTGESTACGSALRWPWW